MRAFHTSATLIGLHDSVRGGHALGIGRGQDYRITTCLERAGAAAVDVIDLKPADRRAPLACLEAGYDIVGDFAVIQFLSRWRVAVAQVARILRPGGLFHFEVFTPRALERPAVRLLFERCGAEHFTSEDFLRELDLNGLPLVWRATRERGQLLMGVAQKPRND